MCVTSYIIKWRLFVFAYTIFSVSVQCAPQQLQLLLPEYHITESPLKYFITLNFSRHQILRTQVLFTISLVEWPLPSVGQRAPRSSDLSSVIGVLSSLFWLEWQWGIRKAALMRLVKQTDSHAESLRAERPSVHRHFGMGQDNQCFQSTYEHCDIKHMRLN